MNARYFNHFSPNIYIHQLGAVATVTSSDVTPAEIRQLPPEIKVITLLPSYLNSVEAILAIPPTVKSIVFDMLNSGTIEQRLVDLLPQHLYVYHGTTCIRRPVLPSPTSIQFFRPAHETLNKRKRNSDNLAEPKRSRITVEPPEDPWPVLPPDSSDEEDNQNRMQY